MQFSIFGVLFKCTKDMFTWEKFKWSLCVYWAHLWRGGVLGIGMLALATAILVVPAFLDSDALQAFKGSDLELKTVMYLSYSLHSWLKDSLTIGRLVLFFWIVSLLLFAFYIQYYAKFRKNYKSFDRGYFTPRVEKFWSGGFWKPFVLTTIVGLLIGFAVGYVLELMGLEQIVVIIINFVIGLVLFHIFLQGGAWGFVPTRRQQNASEQLTVNQ